MISVDDVVEYMMREMTPEEAMWWMEEFEVSDIWHAWFLTFVKWKYIVAMGDDNVEVQDIGLRWTTCGLCRVSELDCTGCPVGRENGKYCFEEYVDWCESDGPAEAVLERIQKEYNRYVSEHKRSTREGITGEVSRYG